ncbi:MAG: MutS-related protein [Chloroflexota bacterium]
MKAFLMYPDRDFDVEKSLPPNEAELRQDLELDTLCNAMGGDDRFLIDTVTPAILSSLTDVETIAYRQEVLRDCLEQPGLIREIYQIAVEAMEGEKKVFRGFFRDSPDTILRRALQVLELFLDLLKRLRKLSDEHGVKFHSEGFSRLFAMLSGELDDEYLDTVETRLKELQFNNGVLIGAELGAGLKGKNFVLHHRPQQSWKERLTLGGRHSYSFQIADRDDNGFKALSELADQGLNLVANALAQSTDHILSFFTLLRTELAFYVGCLNLNDRLVAKGEPTCFPTALPLGSLALSASGLYDICLALNIRERVVGNGLNADDKRLVMITGANQGGKTTFLRALGLAQLMMQCGMFVPAQSFRANVCAGVFTHFKREEDATMKSGKLDEELSRMNAIASHVAPNSILLCNESFASTNEREGSEIAREIVRALLEAGIKVIFVTHMFDLAHGFNNTTGASLFLRADREADGRRTFKLAEGEPRATSHGEDVYRSVFR